MKIPFHLNTLQERLEWAHTISTPLSNRQKELVATFLLHAATAEPFAACTKTSTSFLTNSQLATIAHHHTPLDETLQQQTTLRGRNTYTNPKPTLHDDPAVYSDIWEAAAELTQSVNLAATAPWEEKNMAYDLILHLPMTPHPTTGRMVYTNYRHILTNTLHELQRFQYNVEKAYFPRTEFINPLHTPTPHYTWDTDTYYTTYAPTAVPQPNLVSAAAAVAATTESGVVHIPCGIYKTHLGTLHLTSDNRLSIAADHIQFNNHKIFFAAAPTNHHSTAYITHLRQTTQLFLDLMYHISLAAVAIQKHLDFSQPLAPEDDFDPLVYPLHTACHFFVTQNTLSFSNWKHISALFTNYADVVAYNQESLGTHNPLIFVYAALEYMVDQVPLAAWEQKILLYKVDGEKNSDIAAAINKEFGLSYKTNYISTLWRRICEKIAKEGGRWERQIKFCRKTNHIWNAPKNVPTWKIAANAMDDDIVEIPLRQNVNKLPYMAKV